MLGSMGYPLTSQNIELKEDYLKFQPQKQLESVELSENDSPFVENE
jgi:hypothetical protein